MSSKKHPMDFTSEAEKIINAESMNVPGSFYDHIEVTMIVPMGHQSVFHYSLRRRQRKAGAEVWDHKISAFNGDVLHNTIKVSQG